MQKTDNDYYHKKLFLAEIDKDDNIIGRVERWKAHEKGILHRGFTTLLTFDGQVLLQHRKHVAFDGMWDLTFSSHQMYEGDHLQTDVEAIHNTLEREWNLSKEDLEGNLTKKGQIFYRAKDPKSIFTEHEVDYVYQVGIRRLPTPNLDFAYGFELISLDNSKTNLPKYNLAPWVDEIIREIPIEVY